MFFFSCRPSAAVCIVASSVGSLQPSQVVVIDFYCMYTPQARLAPYTSFFSRVLHFPFFTKFFSILLKLYLDIPSNSHTPNPDYHSSGRMMLNLSAALGRLVLSGREMARLSGFSSRVTGLINVIDDVNKGVYMKRGEYQDSQAGVGSTVARNPAGTSNGSSTGSAAAIETGEVAMRTAAVAAEAEARIHEAAAKKRGGSRNAGVAGVNLSTELTPQWSSSISRKTAAGLVLTPTPPRDTIISSPGMHDASVTGKAAGDAVVESHNYGGFKLRGHPEFAPEVGVGAGEVARERRGEGDVAANGDGGEILGGGKLTRSGEVSRETAGGTAGRVGEVVGGRALSRSGSVVVKEERVIEFQDVPLVTPSGEVLIKALSFKVGEHWPSV